MADLAQLLSQGGSEIVLSEDATLTTAVTISAPLRLIGNGKKLTTSGAGKIKVNIPNAGLVTIEDFGALSWRAPTGTAKNMIEWTDGRFEIKGCHFDPWFPPFQQGTTAEPNISKYGPHAWCIRPNVPTGENTFLLQGCTGESQTYHSCGFMYPTTLRGVVDHRIENVSLSTFHGGPYTADCSATTVRGLSLDRCSWGGVVFSNVDNIDVDGITTNCQGRGSSGDGLDIYGCANYAKLKRVFVHKGSCYGFWFWTSTYPIGTIEMIDCGALNGITTGILAQGTAASPIGKLILDRCTISNNMGRGLYGEYISELQVHRTLFDYNSRTNSNAGNAQYILGGCTIPTGGWTNNFLGHLYTQADLPSGDSKMPYIHGFQ